jgi:hypothetical protein
MDSFYIHLESSASTKNFNENKITNFRNEIVPPLVLESNSYECALVDVAYVYNEPELPKGSKLYTVSRVTKFALEGDPCPFSHELCSSEVGVGPSYYQPSYVKDLKFRADLPENWEDNDVILVRYQRLEVRVSNESDADLPRAEGLYARVRTRLPMTKVKERYVPKPKKPPEPLIAKQISNVQTESTPEADQISEATAEPDLTSYEQRQASPDTTQLMEVEKDSEECLREKYTRLIAEWSSVVDKDLNVETVLIATSCENLSKIIAAKMVVEVGFVSVTPQILNVVGGINKETTTKVIDWNVFHKALHMNKSFELIELEHERNNIPNCGLNVNVEIEWVDVLTSVDRDLYKIEHWMKEEFRAPVAIDKVNGYVGLWHRGTEPLERVILEPQLEEILGLTEFTLEIKQFDQHLKRASFLFDKKHGSRQIYLYSDLIDFVHVGNTTAPLLRTFKYDGNENKQLIQQEFTHLQYKPIVKEMVQEIHIYLRNEMNRIPAIVLGSFAATLHIRRKV